MAQSLFHPGHNRLPPPFPGIHGLTLHFSFDQTLLGTVCDGSRTIPGEIYQFAMCPEKLRGYCKPLEMKPSEHNMHIFRNFPDLLGLFESGTFVNKIGLKRMSKTHCSKTCRQNQLKRAKRATAVNQANTTALPLTQSAMHQPEVSTTVIQPAPSPIIPYSTNPLTEASMHVKDPNTNLNFNTDFGSDIDPDFGSDIDPDIDPDIGSDIQQEFQHIHSTVESVLHEENTKTTATLTSSNIMNATTTVPEIHETNLINN
ncbi:hypothetical protein BC830DRAFT_1234320 [Chytriomyces sp. MP71]|nr:hypothetical protein BC830DRAFT_1234320 [Chytriomyces sp. MP71]